MVQMLKLKVQEFDKTFHKKIANGSLKRYSHILGGFGPGKEMQAIFNLHLQFAECLQNHPYVSWVSSEPHASVTLDSKE